MVIIETKCGVNITYVGSLYNSRAPYAFKIQNLWLVEGLIDHWFPLIRRYQIHISGGEGYV